MEVGLQSAKRTSRYVSPVGRCVPSAFEPSGCKAMISHSSWNRPSPDDLRGACSPSESFTSVPPRTTNSARLACSDTQYRPTYESSTWLRPELIPSVNVAKVFASLDDLAGSRAGLIHKLGAKGVDEPSCTGRLQISAKRKKATMTHHQLSLGERACISALRKAGWWPSAIARLLRRHPSTILREVARNRMADRGYRAHPADCRSRTLRRTCRCYRRLTNRQWQRITRYLRQGWSPEPIVGALRQRRQFRVSHETIYQYLRDDRRAGARSIGTCAAPIGSAAAAPGGCGDTGRSAGRSPAGPRTSRRVGSAAIGRSTP